MREHHDTPGQVELVLKVAAGTIDVETIDGDVTDIEVDQDDVRIDVRTSPSGDHHRIVIEQRKNKARELEGFVLREALGAFGWSKHDVHVRVSVPHGTTMKGDTGSADLVVEGRIGDVEFATGSGDLNLERCEGDVSIRGASADVRISHVGGAGRFEMASGDLTIDEVGGDLSVRSASGDVRVGAAHGSARISTASGDISIEDVARGSVVLNSMSGDIEVGVRSGTRVWLDVSTTSGDATSTLASSDEAAGDASLELRATTVSGDVSIETSTRFAA